jgi:hypothetical protein
MVFEKPLFSTLEAADIAALLMMENLPIHIAAALLSVSRLTLAQWRDHGGGPPFRLIKGGGAVYPRASFESYLRARWQKETETPVRKPREKFRRILSYGGLHEAG